MVVGRRTKSWPSQTLLLLLLALFPTIGAGLESETICEQAKVVPPVVRVRDAYIFVDFSCNSSDSHSLRHFLLTGDYYMTFDIVHQFGGGILLYQSPVYVNGNYTLVLHMDMGMKRLTATLGVNIGPQPAHLSPPVFAQRTVSLKKINATVSAGSTLATLSTVPLFPVDMDVLYVSPENASKFFEMNGAALTVIKDKTGVSTLAPFDGTKISVVIVATDLSNQQQAVALVELTGLGKNPDPDCQTQHFVGFLSNITEPTQFALCNNPSGMHIQYKMEREHIDGLNVTLDLITGYVTVWPPIAIGIRGETFTVKAFNEFKELDLTVHIIVLSVPPTPKIVSVDVGETWAYFELRVAPSDASLEKYRREDLLHLHEISMIAQDNIRRKYTFFAQTSETTFNATGLYPGLKYAFTVTAIGSQLNATTPTSYFTTKGEIPTPRVLPSGPSIVAIGDNVTLTCSVPREFVFNVEWHRGFIILPNTGSVLDLPQVKLSDSGKYVCVAKDGFLQRKYSQPLWLEVFPQEEIQTIERRTDIRLNREWIPELLDRSSFQFSSMEIYVNQLVEFAFRDDFNVMGSSVKSFRNGSIIADIIISERVNRHSPETDTLAYLDRQMENGLEQTFVFHIPGLIQPTSMTQTPLEIIEGSKVRVICGFYILSSTTLTPRLEVSWTLNGNEIDAAESDLFETKEIQLMHATDLGNGYLNNYTLDIDRFTKTLAGKYECTLTGHFDPEASYQVSNSSSILIDRIQALPKATLHPTSLFVEANAAVTLSCEYSNADVVDLMNDDTNETLSSRRAGTDRNGSMEFPYQAAGSITLVCRVVNSRIDVEYRSNRAVITLVKKGTAMCPIQEDTYGMTWQAAPLEVVMTQSCPAGYTGFATKKCGDDGTWLSSDFVNCVREEWTDVLEKIDEYEKGVSPTSTDVENLATTVADAISSPKPVLSGDVKEVVNILSKLSKLVSDDPEKGLVSSRSIEEVAKVGDKILAADDSQWEALQRLGNDTDNEDSLEDQGAGMELIVAMDNLVVASLTDSTFEPEVIVKNEMSITRAVISDGAIEYPYGSKDQYTSHEQWVLNSETSATLSLDALVEKPDALLYSVILYRNIESKMRVNFAGHEQKASDERLFTQKEVASSVLTFSMKTNHSNKLLSPLVLKFPIPKEKHIDPHCGFLNTSLGTVGQWSDSGFAPVYLTSNLVECQYDHLTNFAILMSPIGSVSSQHHEILSIITYLGCVISIVCLILTVAIHILMWRYVKGDRSLLHINLSVCLFLAYVAFLAGINQTDHDGFCTAVAILLQYLFLVVFFLMLVEGIKVMLSVTIVFSRKSRIKVLLAFAYLLPALIVVLSVAATQMDGYRSRTFCWLDVNSGVIWAFVGPVLAIILVNVAILVIVLTTMLRTSAMATKDARQKAKSAIKAIAVLTPLLGLTWVFGVLSVNSDLVAFQYLFALFNTLQGLFIFIFHCVLSRHIQDGFKATWRRRQRSKSFDSTSQKKTGSTTDTRKYSVDSNTYTTQVSNATLTESLDDVSYTPKVFENIAYTADL